MNTNFDDDELDKFGALASHWWDVNGDLKTLHQINPLRLSYIKERVDLSHATALDIGCGGGILTESLFLAGANVTGIDMNKAVIDVAKLHQLESGTKVEYQQTTAEAFAAEHPQQFDLITCLEILEHVPEPHSIVKACAQLLKPGGHIFFSTLNRNLKSYFFAIIGAEQILRLLPKGTHDYAKFIRPSELRLWASEAGLKPQAISGISYHPFSQTFTLTDDVSVNYLLYAIKS